MPAPGLLKSLLGPRWTTRARTIVRGQPRPHWGNLRRTEPFSTNYGADRGTPIDRYYLNQFLTEHGGRIAGSVLEIQGSSITKRYGRGVTAVETIDIDARFNATYTCDWAEADRCVPASRYDCVLLPNTLQHLRDIEGSLRQAMRVLTPGGSIVATACAFVPLIPDGPDYWRLSPEGWREVAARVFEGHAWSIQDYGNCLSAVAALMGLAVEELSAEELDVKDPRYPVLIGLTCQKRT